MEELNAYAKVKKAGVIELSMHGPCGWLGECGLAHLRGEAAVAALVKAGVAYRAYLDSTGLFEEIGLPMPTFRYIYVDHVDGQFLVRVIEGNELESLEHRARRELMANNSSLQDDQLLPAVRSVIQRQAR